MSADDVTAALARVVAGLPGGGEPRAGQLEMAQAVGRAIAGRRHLVVQAPTGVGKSLAYLVPALLSGSRVVVATATKALQDQLAHQDLPLVAAHLGLPVNFAVLKGRSNYLCRQRAVEVAGGGDQLDLDTTGPPGGGGGNARAPAGADDVAPGVLGREVQRLLRWAATAEVGDRADLPFEPSARAWSSVSVGAMECPGANRCPSGDDCFTEAARRRAALADVIVVNTHLYATHLAAGGAILPPHDVVIFDEAHEVEDVASASFGREVGAGRFAALARTARPLVSDSAILQALDDAGGRLAAAIEPHCGDRLGTPLPEDVHRAATLARERLAALSRALRAGDGDVARKARAQQSAGHLAGDLDVILDLPATHVAWAEGPVHNPVLKVAPIEVGPLLARLLWEVEEAPTAVLTSATIPPGIAGRVGLAAGSYDEVAVASPFDFPRQALLYCATRLPDPRHADYEPAMHAELEALIRAAGGRTLALFTSWRAMERAARALTATLPWPVLTQSDLPKPALVERFRSEERSCLFATMGFWQGVDVPGPALSLVTLDRIPFPRPDEPLLQARRDKLGPAAFRLVDLPRAATLLAQGAGRLIRASSDRGVVAVLDPRLASARSYRWILLETMPAMPRTRDRAEVEAFLAPLRQGGPG